MHPPNVGSSLFVAICVAVLSGCAMPPPAPESGFDLRIGMGGSSIPISTRPLSSLYDQKWDHVMRQELDFSCGAAALATLFNFYYGDWVDETEIITSMLLAGDQDRIRSEGFSINDMRLFVEARGYEGKAFRIEPEVLEQLAIPAITLVNTRGYSHFFIIKGARAGIVYLADPALGHRAVPREQFVQEWSGVLFFAAAESDTAKFSPLAQLEAGSPAPGWMVRQLDFMGLLYHRFNPGEF